jgi:hypothetical protein
VSGGWWERDWRGGGCSCVMFDPVCVPPPLVVIITPSRTHTRIPNTPHTTPHHTHTNKHQSTLPPTTHYTTSLFGRRRRPAHLRDYEVYAHASSEDEEEEEEVR